MVGQCSFDLYWAGAKVYRAYRAGARPIDHPGSCQYFKDMAIKALGKCGQWANYKHLYFVFTVIGSLDSDRDAFIHAPSFSFNEVKRILESDILANRIP
jgi:hypothetical protein